MAHTCSFVCTHIMIFNYYIILFFLIQITIFPQKAIFKVTFLIISTKVLFGVHCSRWITCKSSLFFNTKLRTEISTTIFYIDTTHAQRFHWKHPIFTSSTESLSKMYILLSSFIRTVWGFLSTISVLFSYLFSFFNFVPSVHSVLDCL